MQQVGAFFRRLAGAARALSGVASLLGFGALIWKWLGAFSNLAYARQVASAAVDPKSPWWNRVLAQPWYVFAAAVVVLGAIAWGPTIYDAIQRSRRKHPTTTVPRSCGRIFGEGVEHGVAFTVRCGDNVQRCNDCIMAEAQARAEATTPLPPGAVVKKKVASATPHLDNLGSIAASTVDSGNAIFMEAERILAGQVIPRSNPSRFVLGSNAHALAEETKAFLLVRFDRKPPPSSGLSPAVSGMNALYAAAAYERDTVRRFWTKFGRRIDDLANDVKASGLAPKHEFFKTMSPTTEAEIQQLLQSLYDLGDVLSGKI